MKTYKFPSQNESIYEVLSKSDNGKVVKYKGEIFGWVISRKNMGGWLQNKGGKFGEEDFENKIKPINFHLKMNLCTKFHPNQKMVKFKVKIF